MRLTIFSRPPFRNSSGGQKRAFQILKSISKQTDTVILVSNENEKYEIQNEFSKFSNKLIIITHTKIDMIFGLLISLMLCKWYTPINVRLYFNLKIYMILKNSKYQNIICNNIRTSPYPIFQKKVFVDFVDCISDNYKTAALTSKNLIVKFIYSLESYLTRKYEKHILANCYKSFSVSKHESSLLKNETLQVESIPVYIENFNNYFKLHNSKSNKKLIIGFLGKMNYEPNIKAVDWFINKIYSNIKSNNIEFRIIGGHVPKKLLNKKNQNIRFLGWVENIHLELDSCDVLIAPMQSGSGLQTKILDYLQHSKIILCTKRALNGFNKWPNFKNVYVIDNYQDYIKILKKINIKKTKYKMESEKVIIKERMQYLKENFSKKNIIELWRTLLEIDLHLKT